MPSRTSVVLIAATLFLSMASSLVFAQTPAVMSFPFSISSGGSVSLAGANNTNSLDVGFARILPVGVNVVADGFEVLQFRQSGVTVSETAVPASNLVTAQSFFVEAAGNVTTAVTIANPNPQPATISFGFKDPVFPMKGSPVNTGTLTLPPHSQIARFITEPPFNGPTAPYIGLMSITSSVPVGITSLRGLVNERSEFIMAPLLTGFPAPGTFVSLPGQPAVTVGYVPLFAEGGGWNTDIVVINPNLLDAAFGTFDFFDANGKPVAVTINGTTGSSINWGAGFGRLEHFVLSGSGSGFQGGYVRITAGAHSTSFDCFAILTFKQGAATVAMTTIPMMQPSGASRIYVEQSADGAEPVQTGIAISNGSAVPAAVTLVLSDVNGHSTGLSWTLVIPPFGQVAKFLREIPGFQSVPSSFRGLVQITTDAPSGLSVVGMRAHTNERSDLLFSTLLPIIQPAQTDTTSERMFPQVVQGTGWNTEFVLFNRDNGTASTGTVAVISENGVPLNFK